MLYLIRGLPGSGKSSLADSLGLPVYSADDFFYELGYELGKGYAYDPSRIKEAHEACQNNTRRTLQVKEGAVVANTFAKRWELEPYINMAREFGVRLTIMDLFDGGLTDDELAERNIHDVPAVKIAQMRAGWEHCWREGDPRAPWERE